MTPYQKLPSPPSELSEGKLLARLVDAIGFRYAIATKGLTANEINFRPTAESRNLLELMIHIYQLIDWTRKAFEMPYSPIRELEDFEVLRTETLVLCHLFSQFQSDLTPEQIVKTSVYLKRMDTHFSFWYLINGPLADALTHIGQINSWRRIAGNPIDRISPFTGEVY